MNEASGATTPLEPNPNISGGLWRYSRMGLIGLFSIYNLFLIALMAWLNPKNDFGRTFSSAENIYAGRPLYAINESVRWELETGTIHLLNLNPPHFHILLLPFVGLGPNVSLGIWIVAQFACLAFLIRTVLREIDLAPSEVNWEVAVLAILAFAGTASWLVTGHLAIFLAGMATLAWRAERRGRFAEAGAWIGAAASVKLLFLIFLPYWLAKGRWRALAGFLAVFTGCFVVGWLTFGTHAFFEWIDGMRNANTWAYLPMNMSIFGVLQKLFRPTSFYIPLLIAKPSDLGWTWLALAGAIGLTTIFVASLNSSKVGVDRGYTLLLIGAILISPLGWLYYFWLPAGPAIAYFQERVRVGGSIQNRERKFGSLARWLFLASLVGFFYPCLTIRPSREPSGLMLLPATIHFIALVCCWLSLVVDGINDPSTNWPLSKLSRFSWRWKSNRSIAA